MATQLSESFDDTTQDTDNEPVARDYEAEARSHGWTPEDEFKGDKTRWIDAETFTKRADEVMPLLKKKTQAQDREIAALKKTIEQAADHYSKAEERSYKRAIDELKTRQEQAVESGDVEAHRAIGKEIDELAAEAKPSKAKADVPDELEVTESLIEWRIANPWYDAGGVEKDYCDMLATKYKAKTADMRPAEFYAFIAEKTLERFPNAATKSERRRPVPAVEGGGNRGNPRGGQSFEALPADAKAMCDRMHKMGIMKGAGGKELTQAEARAQYVKDYAWDSK